MASRSQHFPPSTRGHRCWCELDLTALTHNLAWIRQRIGPQRSILATVKANAYGHGAEPIARFLEQADCQWLGCAHVHEGLALRQAGIRKPILMLSPALPEEMADAARADLMFTVSSVEEIRALNTIGRRLRRRVGVHLKIDTGMGRLGCLPSEFAACRQALEASRWVNWAGLCTHFAAADDNPDMTAAQWKQFSAFQHAHPFIHLCNSAGILNAKQALGSCVRPGLLLYGVAPGKKRVAGLRPVLTWKARIVLIRDLPAGATISYGATHRLRRATRVAVVSAGYGDGLFRSISHRGSVLIGAKRCPILGRVTMDLIMVDIQHVPSCVVGDEVVLLGVQGNERIHATEMARWAGTIPWEIWCHITPRVPRLILSPTHSNSP